jgi:5-formyltetrahydrofolate cyclo-ligase
LSDRSELRLWIAQEREAHASAVETDSLRVVKNLVRWLPELADRVLGSYRVVPDNRSGEVDLASLASEERFARTHIAYPRVLDRIEREMDFAIPISENDWMPGPFGIPQPRYDLQALGADEIDVILIPGVVFGVRGERLGRGAGYYDRFLSGGSKALRVGIAFDFQVVSDPVPQEAWDAPMDAIVTESRILEITKKT